MNDISIIQQIEKIIGKNIPSYNHKNLNYNLYYHINKPDSKRITTLKLNNCQIDNIELISELDALQELDLFGNEIEDISLINRLPNLKYLNLSKNKIKSIEPISNLTQLETLSLTNNKIESIDNLNLKNDNITVDLQYNIIKNIPEWISNHLIAYSPYFHENVINLYNNPIVNPPLEILLKGNDSIKKWFENPLVPINEVKVLLVGSGDVGKSTLVKSLIGQKTSKGENATKQIQITTYFLNHNQEKVKLNFWDFGGQEIMHSTHQFFLTKRSIYILVLDGRRDEDPEYWLKHIESFGGNSPVLVVMNKIRDNPRFDVNRQFLLDKYPSIIGFYRTECINEVTGIDELLDGVKIALNKVEIITTLWPKNWFAVKNAIENTEDEVISQDKYENICDKFNVKDIKTKELLANYLNDLGAVVHFNDSNISHLHILQPRWASGAAYKIITAESIIANGGIFDEKILQKILRKTSNAEYEYKSNTHKFIVELMLKFELCYLVCNNTYLIPELLGVQQPSLPQQHGPILQFYFKYEEILPRSIIPRFIVRMNNDIKDNLRWRTGVVLALPIFQSTAIVILDEKDKKIRISVSGRERSEHLSVIRKEFHDLNRTFEKLNVTEWVPFPDDSSRAVEYAELKGYEISKKDTYFSGLLNKNYSVKDLLNGIDKNISILNKKYPIDVFISYSSKDSDIIDLIIKDLGENGISYWRDKNMIEFGDSIIKEISNGLKESRILLLCFSKNQNDSEWSNEEWRNFMSGILISTPEQRLIVLILDDSGQQDIPVFLGED